MGADLQALYDSSPHDRALGFRIERAEEGVVLRGTLGAGSGLDESGGVAHGGVVASLLDTAATFALIALSEHDWSTVDLRVDYLRPTPLGPVVVTGQVVRAGRSLGRARSDLRDAAGRVCATAVGTFVPNAERPV